MKEKVSFFSEGSRIAGVLYTPRDVSDGKRPGVVLCQGFSAVKESFLPAIAERLADAGYGALIFDYRYFGESEGEPRERLLPLCQVEDTRNAITFLQLQPWIDAERLGLYGTSFGGAIVTYTAAIDSRVKCVVSMGGVGNGERWLRGLRPYWQWQKLRALMEKDREKRVREGVSEHVDTLEIMYPDPDTEVFWKKMTLLALKELPQWGTKITMESAEAVCAFRPEDSAGRISPRAALWLHAVRDALVPADESAAMFRAAGEPRKMVLIDCGHWEAYRGEPFEQVIAHALEWFGLWLKP